LLARVPFNGGSWRATYYGGTGTDLVNSIAAFLEGAFVFGTTTSTNLPVKNIGSGSFIDLTFNGGDTPPLDIFFATFDNTLQTHLYGTYIGGLHNDYLGRTGDPRGSNNLFSNSGNLWLGNTVHSGNPTAITPGVISAGSFDPDKTAVDSDNTDVHLIFRLGGVGTTV